ncbi:MAG: TVP38/TMEM64 family protein [Anaerolineae bacterium]|jgi:uncharacterized membrane protein YdjX (TVP38/TMEM64 family)
MADQERPRVRWWVWLLAGLVLVALLAALIRWWEPLYQFLSDQERVAAWVQGLGLWGPVAITLLELIQALLAPIPGQAIEAVSGYLYGPWLGVVFPLIGIGIGSLITFTLARRFGRPLAIRLIGKSSMDRLDDLVERGGAPFFFLIWLLPFAPDDLACVAAGLTPMPTRQFMILMIIGRLPGIFVSVWVGANAARIEPVWWVVIFVIIAIAALILWRWGDQIQEAILSFIERISHRFEGS